jgi:hypothetical protein
MRFRGTFRWIGLLVAIVAVLVVPLGCNLFKTVLTITNRSGSDIDFVSWTDDGGHVYYFSNTLVDDTTLGWVDGLSANGGADTQQVGTGSDYIDFFFTDDVTGYRTTQVVSVSRYEDAKFTFYDTTIIVARQGASGQTTTEAYGIVPSGRTKPGAQ